MKVLKALILGSLVFSSTSFAVGMSCLVETKAFDEFSEGICVGVEFFGPNSTTAVYRIDNPPANYYIDWHDPVCGTTALTCSRTIRAYRDVVGSATVIDLSTGQAQTVSASARYETGL